MIGAIALRCAPYLLAACALLGLAGLLYRQGYSAGSDAERVAGQARDAERVKVEAAALARRHQENDQLRAAQERSNLKEAIAHEQADLAVQMERDRLRGDVRRAGGLRIPVPAACGGLAADAQAPLDGQPGAPAAGTVALPDQITEHLLALAFDADKVVEQARAMQKRLLEDAGEP